VPNKYEPFDPAHEFTWTAPPGANGHVSNGDVPNGHLSNGQAPAATNGHRAAPSAAPGTDDLEIATGSVLLFAQRVADDTIADAHREAERILDQARTALPAPARNGTARPMADAPGVAELRDRSEQLLIESRLRNLLMNDLVECVAALSMRVEREIGDAMQILERARERAIADFSAINALARLAGMPPDAQPASVIDAQSTAPRTDAHDEPGPVPTTDSFVIDLRDALNNDRNATEPDDFDELFARRGVYMESRESRRSRWIRSAGLFSTVLGNGNRADG
jgi:hypothetical protein